MTQAPPSNARPDRDAYRDAGVDIALGNAFVDAIRPAAGRTARPGLVDSLGGFAGLFDLKAAGHADPLLVAATDGVGTKILLAQAAGRYRGLGTDLVAMCVNDIVVQGAEPLFFLDYFATGRLDGTVARSVVEGIADACAEVGCALLGGETAEMPGVYGPGVFDLAGFAVGAVARDRLLPRRAEISRGDQLVAVASNGLHSNGFSLVRRIVATAAVDLAAPAPFAPERCLDEVLLEPTRLYGRAASVLADEGASALAHITGGGLLENVPRVLGDGMRARVDLDSFVLPPVFRWLAEAGGLDRTTLARTFNCGVGLVGILPPAKAEAAVVALNADPRTASAWLLGTIERAPGPPSLVLTGDGDGWPRA